MLLVLPAVVYVTTVLAWDRGNSLRLTGDEPHYAIIADSIVRDVDLDVRNNYAVDAERRVIFGPVDPHSSNASGGRYSDHGVGLPFLLAPAFAGWGPVGARAFLAAVVGLYPFALFAAARRRVGELGALAIALTLSLALPFAAGAGQIYPDLLTGLCVLTALLLLDREWRRPHPRATIGAPAVALAALLALLPWLHLKNQAPAGLILAVWMAVRLWPAGTPATRVRRLVPCLLPVASMVLLAWYHASAFGTWTGPFRAGAQDASAKQVAMVLLGLHFDQAQGMFMQQPLLWVGLAGLGAFAVRERLGALLVAAVYASMIVPNAMHMNMYGGWSFAGRFAWSSFPLWVFPITAAFAALGARRRFEQAALLASSAFWSVWLASTWLAAPAATFYPRTPLALDRYTFAPPLRAVLPSFVDVGGFVSHPSNWAVVWLASMVCAFGVDRALRAERSHR